MTVPNDAHTEALYSAFREIIGSAPSPAFESGGIELEGDAPDPGDSFVLDMDASLMCNLENRYFFAAVDLHFASRMENEVEVESSLKKIEQISNIVRAWPKPKRREFWRDMDERKREFDEFVGCRIDDHEKARNLNPELPAYPGE